jgi:hypothetical protein
MPEAARAPGLAPFSLRDEPSLIERVFPAQKIGVEAQKERKSGAGQTLTALGSYWKGRKPLVLAGIGGMGLSTVGLIVALQVKASNPGSATLLGYVAIVFVLLFVAFFEVGLGAIPWAIGGEIFPTESSGAAMALAAAVNWVCTMLIGVLFPILNKALPNGLSFLPFAATLALGARAGDDGRGALRATAAPRGRRGRGGRARGPSACRGGGARGSRRRRGGSTGVRSRASRC